MLTVDADIWRKINQGMDLGQCREEVAIFKRFQKGSSDWLGEQTSRGEDMHRRRSKRRSREAEGVAIAQPWGRMASCVRKQLEDRVGENWEGEEWEVGCGNPDILFGSLCKDFAYKEWVGHHCGGIELRSEEIRSDLCFKRFLLDSVPRNVCKEGKMEVGCQCWGLLQ